MLACSNISSNYKSNKENLKSQKFFQDELMQLRKQQTKDTKLLSEAVLYKSTISERDSRFFSAEGISNS